MTIAEEIGAAAEDIAVVGASVATVAAVIDDVIEKSYPLPRAVASLLVFAVLIGILTVFLKRGTNEQAAVAQDTPLLGFSPTLRLVQTSYTRRLWSKSARPGC
jgi:uncharacterized membrane protein